jgi:hypothetical protein
LAQAVEPLHVMSERAQNITKWLFWAAFGVFLAVSIPHIAWCFRQYEPDDAIWWVNICWNVLAYAYAIAIDAVIAWLSHIQSVVGAAAHKSKGDQVLTWCFLLALVALSWYFNWVFALAHDPAVPRGWNVWSYQLTDQWGSIAPITIGQLTPVLISALPVFIIAYTFILSKVAQMKALAAKSLAELEREADEAEQRAQAERRIKDARRGKSLIERAKDVSKEAIGAADEIREELGKKKKSALAQEEAEHSMQTTEQLDMLLIANQREDEPETDPIVQSLVESEQSRDEEASLLEESGAARIWWRDADRHLDTDQYAIISCTDQETKRDIASEEMSEEDKDDHGMESITPHNQSSGALTEIERLRKDGRRVLSIEETAKLTGYSLRYLKKLVRDKKIAASQQVRNAVLLSSLATYVERQQRASVER